MAVGISRLTARISRMNSRRNVRFRFTPLPNYTDASMQVSDFLVIILGMLEQGFDRSLVGIPQRTGTNF